MLSIYLKHNLISIFLFGSIFPPFLFFFFTVCKCLIARPLRLLEETRLLLYGHLERPGPLRKCCILFHFISAEEKGVSHVKKGGRHTRSYELCRHVSLSLPCVAAVDTPIIRSIAPLHVSNFFYPTRKISKIGAIRSTKKINKKVLALIRCTQSMYSLQLPKMSSNLTPILKIGARSSCQHEIARKYNPDRRFSFFFFPFSFGRFYILIVLTHSVFFSKFLARCSPALN